MVSTIDLSDAGTLNRIHGVMSKLVNDASTATFRSWEAAQHEDDVAGTCGDASRCVLVNYFTSTAPSELRALIEDGKVGIEVEPIRASVNFYLNVGFGGSFFFTMDRDLANVGCSFDDLEIEHPSAHHPTFGELREWLQWSSTAD